MIPIVTPTEMGAIDRAAPEPVEVLVERAGAAVAREALDLLGGGYGRRAVVLAGKGNNGADGRSAARRLRRRGVRTTVVDAADAPGRLPPADLVVDAAYGTGFHGTYEAPEPPPGALVLAVDIPSGVDGLTGAAGGRVLAATRTVTFAALKPGLLLGEGLELAGEVRVADIGLDASTASAHVVEGADVAAWIPRPRRDAHKWRTACWVVAGSPGMTGAARLCAGGAQRAGAGYVRLSSPGVGPDPMAPTEVVSTALPEADWAEDVLGDLDRFAAVAVGPGLGTAPATVDSVRRLVAGARLPVVVDGDGLTALATGGPADPLRARSTPAVLTPHDGELARLAGPPGGADRVGAVRELASSLGAVVLAKGSTTVVAEPGGAVLVTTSGDARLATAGTGDVLTGVIVALLAGGVAPLRAAAAGAHLHGRAGALACRRGLVAGDLIDHLPAAFAELPET